MFTDKPKGAEFNVGDVITLDRYNHIDDVVKATIVGYERYFSDKLLYCFSQSQWSGHVFCKSTGASIMESKNYDPVPDDERHPRQHVKAPPYDPSRG